MCYVFAAWAWAGPGSGGRRWGVGEMEKLGISLSPVCSVLYLCEVVASSCTDRH